VTEKRQGSGEANSIRTQIALAPRLISQTKMSSSASRTVTADNAVFRISHHESPRQRPKRPAVDRLTVAFGMAVARRRRAMGFSWRMLGMRCRVSGNTIRNVERGAGNSRLDIVARVAAGLGTPLWRLIREAEESHP
jgi:ribosome-binding protein aMBF1 (putative translation factor)